MNEKNPLFRKEIFYLLVGMICTGLGQFISGRADIFTDWEFISGILLGAAIFSYLHAAFYFGVRIRQLRENHKNEE